MTAVELHVAAEEVTEWQEFTPSQLELLKATVAKGTSDAEFELFCEVASRTGLDPFQRQIYAIMRYSKRDGREVMTIQTGIDGYRLIAERTRAYQGQTPAEWCGPDGEWVDVWLHKQAPSAARVGVHKKGFVEPLYKVALWGEYAQTYKDGNPSGQWATMPALMLSKCSEALALRAAFPADLSGIYTAEEMGQTDREKVQATRTARPAITPAVVEPGDAARVAGNLGQLPKEARDKLCAWWAGKPGLDCADLTAWPAEAVAKLEGQVNRAIEVTEADPFDKPDPAPDDIEDAELIEDDGGATVPTEHGYTQDQMEEF